MNVTAREPWDGLLQKVQRYQHASEPLSYLKIAGKKWMTAEGDLKEENPSLQNLVGLFFRKDADLYRERFGNLSNEQISDIYQQTGLLLDLLVQERNTRSATKSIRNYRSEDKNAANYLVFEYMSHKVLRENQKNHIDCLLSPQRDGLHKNYFFQMKMGDGKTTTVIPLVCAAKPNGQNIVGVLVSAELFNTNLTDFSKASYQLFGQAATPFRFDRSLSEDKESLISLRDKLCRCQESKDYIVTTKQDIQAIELSYISLLLQNGDQSCIQLLEDILRLLKEKGDFYIDEVDSVMNPVEHLNYVLDIETLPHPVLVQLQTDFWTDLLKVENYDSLNRNQWLDFFIKNENSFLRKSFGKNFEKHDEATWISFLKGNSDLNVNFLPLATRRTLAFMRGQFSSILERADSKVKNVDYGLTQKRYSKKIENETAIPYKGNMKPKENSRFGSVYETFLYTTEYHLNAPLSENLLLKYVNQINSIVDVIERQEAVRRFYKELNVSEKDFPFKELVNLIGDQYPPAVYTIKKRIIRGGDSFFRSLFPNGKTASLEDLIMDAFSEVEAIEDEASKQDALRAFLINAGHSQSEGSFKSLKPKVVSNDKLKGLINKIEENKSVKQSLVIKLLNRFVYPKVKINPVTVLSTSSDAMMSLGAIQGASGTLDQGQVFRPGVVFDGHGLDETFKNLTDCVLNDEKTTLKIDKSDKTDIRAYLEAHIGNNTEEYQAIIDLGIRFKGIPHETVAHEMAQYWKEKESEKPEEERKKYILYFNAKDVLCAISIVDGKVIAIGASDNIAGSLGCKLNDYVAYFDQVHTRGTNIPFAKNAKAVMNVNKDNTKTDDFQALMRMRGFESSQNIDIVADFECSSKKELLEVFERNEEARLLKTYEAVDQQIKAIYRRHLLDYIIAIKETPNTKSMKSEMTRKAKGLLYQVEKTDPLDLFLDAVEYPDADLFFKTTIENYEKLYKNAVGSENKINLDNLKAEILTKVINRYKHFFPKNIKRKTPQSLGEHVQIQNQLTVQHVAQKENEVEQKKEQKFQTDTHQSPPVKKDLKKWESVERVLQAVSFMPMGEVLDLQKEMVKKEYKIWIEPEVFYASPNVILNEGGAFLGNRFKRPACFTLFIKNKITQQQKVLLVSSIELDELKKVVPLAHLEYEFCLRTQDGLFMAGHDNGEFTKEEKLLQEKSDFLNGNVKSDLLKVENSQWFWSKDIDRKALWSFFKHQIAPCVPWKDKEFSEFGGAFEDTKVVLPAPKSLDFDWASKPSPVLNDVDVPPVPNYTTWWIDASKNKIDPKEFQKLRSNDNVLKEVNRLQVEQAAQEQARLKAEQEAEKAAKIQAQKDQQEAIRIKKEEAIAKANKAAKEAARVWAEQEAEKAAKLKAEKEAAAAAKAQQERQAREEAAAKAQQEREAQEAAKAQAEKEAQEVAAKAQAETEVREAQKTPKKPIASLGLKIILGIVETVLLLPMLVFVIWALYKTWSQRKAGINPIGESITNKSHADIEQPAVEHAPSFVSSFEYHLVTAMTLGQMEDGLSNKPKKKM